MSVEARIIHIHRALFVIFPFSHFMKNFNALLSAALLTLSLASCSKESYTFRAPSSSHHTVAASAATAAPAQAADVAQNVAPAFTASTAPAAAPAVARKSARTYSAHVQAEKAATATAAAPTRAEIKEAKATIKALHKAAKKNQAAAPLAEGKSQGVALLLVILVGVLGIHRFYLGYTGVGIAQLLTLGGCGIWSLIDLIRIITGDLKPKGGDYAKKL